VASSPVGLALARGAAAVRWVEDALLALVLGAMVVLAPLQILLRSAFDAGISWGDPMLRVLVLWIGMLGAVVASRDERHITIDVASRLLPVRGRDVVGALTCLFASGVSGLVAWHAARFVASEIEYETIAFAAIPAWVLESVIPAAFAAIAVRYLLRSGAHIVAAVTGETSGESSGEGRAP
jgi:TRAP-type C4-dicarboxylate transport system permease small subunit